MAREMNISALCRTHSVSTLQADQQYDYGTLVAVSKAIKAYSLSSETVYHMIKSSGSISM